MSYLTVPTVPSFSKAVISFWYKVPQASLDAAQAEAEAFDGDQPPPLLGFVPLVVFGKEGTGPGQLNASSQPVDYHWSNTMRTCEQGFSYDFVGECKTGELFANETAKCNCTDDTVNGTSSGSKTSYVASPGPPSPPSYVALDGSGNIQINLESTMFGDAVLASVVTESKPGFTTGASSCLCLTFSLNFPCKNGTRTIQMIVVSPLGCIAFFPPEEYAGEFPGDDACGAHVDSFPVVVLNPGTTTENSETYGPPPTDQLMSAVIGFSSSQADVTPVADRWHHVLISIDLTGGSASYGKDASDTPGAITATSTMYLAIDDVNYPTSNLFPGTNKVAATVAQGIAGTQQAVNGITHAPEGPIPSYSISNMSIPAAQLGIPSVGKYVDRIHQVEMAEFQMWTGVTLDTSVVANRRLFIDSKGRPVDPSLIQTLSTMAIGDPSTWDPGADIPAPPLVPDTSNLGAIAPRQLGKPVISFTRSDQNWIKAHNLGTLKGKVTRTGKIKSYRPDPQLGR